MNKKVVVTGATGLVGSHFLLKLVDEYEDVVAVYRDVNSINLIKKLFDYYKKSNQFHKVRWAKSDVSDLESLTTIFQGSTAIYHTAALVSFEKKDADKLFKTNVDGTKNVLKAIEKNKISSLIFISSVASIRYQNKEGLFSAEGNIDVQKDWTDYARSKAQSEALVLEAKEKGLKTIIVNPGVILGPGDITKSSTAIFNTVKQGLKFYTLGVNGFVDVRDVVDFSIKLYKSKEVKARYVCVGANIQFKKLFTIIANDLKVSPPRFKANNIMLALAWRLEFLLSRFQNRPPKITRDNTSSALANIQYCSESIISDTRLSFRTMKEASQNAVNFFNYIES